MSTEAWIAAITAFFIFLGGFVTFITLSMKLGAILECAKASGLWQIEHEKKDEKNFGVLYDRTNSHGERLASLESSGHGYDGPRGHYGHG